MPTPLGVPRPDPDSRQDAIAWLVAGLSRPEAYPHPAAAIELRQTHISLVFLAGSLVYKLKKPVKLPFLDFSTRKLRAHFCRQEVRLNRRLAPEVYRGVVAVRRGGDGLPRIGGDGPIADWAVCMERLDPAATLLVRLDRDTLDGDLVTAAARRIAAFHSRARRGPAIDRLAGFAAVAGHVRDNFRQSRGQVGNLVSGEVFTRLEAASEGELERQRKLLESRLARGLACDGHGDLHLDHVYAFPERKSPGDLVIIDCVEFSPALRACDPVADMAFLDMDLAYRGRPDLARSFASAYFEASGDDTGRELLPLFSSYRAAVRAKVAGIAAASPEIAEAIRSAAADSARRHWLFALGMLLPPGERPALIAVAGLPGSGKSTLARALAASAGLTVIASDRVRKELASVVSSAAPARAAFGAGIYTPAWTERTYDECFRRAEAILFAGGRPLIDASFADPRFRQRLADLGRRWAVPVRILEVTAPAATVRSRLRERRGDISDAGVAVYEQARRRYPPAPSAPSALARVWRTVDASGDAGETLTGAIAHLREAELAGA